MYKNFYFSDIFMFFEEKKNGCYVIEIVLGRNRIVKIVEDLEIRR